MEDQVWTARDRTVIAKTKQYLEDRESMKEDEELESLLGPEDSEVDFGRLLEETRNNQGRAILETFSSEGRVNSWSSAERDGMNTKGR